MEYNDIIDLHFNSIQIIGIFVAIIIGLVVSKQVFLFVLILFLVLLCIGNHQKRGRIIKIN